MLLGAHMSIAGGVHNAVTAGKETGCNCIQVFTKSSNQWKAKPLTQKDVTQFKDLVKETKISPIVAHDSYLINIASPDQALREKSINALLEEVERAELLEIPFLVMHPGARMDSNISLALKRVAEGINRIYNQTLNYNVMICLEITAGQGTTLGRTFEELQEIIEQVKDSNRIGVCLDTCHLYAAGYDLKTKSGFKEAIGSFEKILGFDKLKVVHLNDSKKGLNCHVDRHEHIGKGMLGLEPFQWILNDPRFANIPLILETPKGVSNKEDLENLALLRSLLKKN